MSGIFTVPAWLFQICSSIFPCRTFQKSQNACIGPTLMQDIPCVRICLRSCSLCFLNCASDTSLEILGIQVLSNFGYSQLQLNQVWHRGPWYEAVWAANFASLLHWFLLNPSSISSCPTWDVTTSCSFHANSFLFCVPRIHDSSLLNWVKLVWGGNWKRRGFCMMATLWQSYSWLVYWFFSTELSPCQKFGLLLITFWAKTWSLSAKDSSDSFTFWVWE